MFDDPRDLNRNPGRDPYDRVGNLPSEGVGYGLPLALLVMALIIGGLIAFAPTNENTQTAANSPRVQRTAPPVAPPVAPAPPVTAPKQ